MLQRGRPPQTLQQSPLSTRARARVSFLEVRPERRIFSFFGRGRRRSRQRRDPRPRDPDSLPSPFCNNRPYTACAVPEAVEYSTDGIVSGGDTTPSVVTVRPLARWGMLPLTTVGRTTATRLAEATPHSAKAGRTRVAPHSSSPLGGSPQYVLKGSHPKAPGC